MYILMDYYKVHCIVVDTGVKKETPAMCPVSILTLL